MKLELGNMLSGPGQHFVVDPGILVDTRLLLTANSGGGKSWGARKLVEEVHGKVQVIILDPEGEFATLREKFDFVLAGKGGDIPADPRHASLMARKAMELGMDLIVDLYELHPRERIQFVRRFLEGLDQLPKDLWHPVLVLVDEAHIFAPEQGSSEAADAMAALVSRGRKRGLGAVLLTQRLSKLAKDVAAECRNKLIGLANLDLDRKRGADELGFTDKAQVLMLRDLAAGQFYAVGPAFPKGVNAVRIGQVKTSHPKAGAHKAARPPAPSAKVKAALAKLSDLPKEAEQEAKTLADLQTQVRTLKGQLQAREREIVAPKPVQAPSEAILKRLSEQATHAANSDARFRIKKALDEYQDRLVAATKTCDQAMNEAFKEFKDQVWKPWAAIPLVMSPVKTLGTVAAPQVVKRLVAQQTPPTDSSGLGKCEKAILAVLAQKPGATFSRAKIGARSGYSKNSSGFANALSSLRTKGLISGLADQIALPADVDVSGLGLPAVPQGLEDWLGRLGKCERAIFQELLNARPGAMPREHIAEATGYSATSSGFANSLSYLKTLGLITAQAAGFSANPELED